MDINESAQPWTFLIRNKKIFVEKLAGLRVEVPEVTQSEQGQKQKLQIILTVINRILQQSPPWTQSKWSVDSKLFIEIYVVTESILDQSKWSVNSKLFVEYYNRVPPRPRANGAWTVSYL